MDAEGLVGQALFQSRHFQLAGGVGAEGVLAHQVLEQILERAQPAKRPPAAPAGRARQVFDAVLKLPRKQQAKVVEMAEGFLALHAKPG